jgi:hypothetical protein
MEIWEIQKQLKRGEMVQVRKVNLKILRDKVLKMRRE